MNLSSKTLDSKSLKDSKLTSTKSKHVAIFLYDLSTFGGVETTSLNLAYALQAKGLKVTFITIRAFNKKSTIKLPFKIYILEDEELLASENSPEDIVFIKNNIETLDKALATKANLHSTAPIASMNLGGGGGSPVIKA
ncbi:hypothetical protein [Helicobacter sp. 11S02629-2]|uniref:hypothetical protein n=1 Tax=Helicobacter sp. 11S02629-2 TaxID=1476195 RepID=UPI000BA6D33A|nr:hypothetical protein [Helicobacter sp. 11S02629-2]PAF45580.1 hypothetical protein BKH40_01485 [Helicobacter sp. 11S02629-2]